MIRRDQSNALIVPPDLDGLTVNIAACFDQGGIIILAFDDLRRAAHSVFMVQYVETIRDHEWCPVDARSDFARGPDCLLNIC